MSVNSRFAHKIGQSWPVVEEDVEALDLVSARDGIEGSAGSAVIPQEQASTTPLMPLLLWNDLKTLEPETGGYCSGQESSSRACVTRVGVIQQLRSIAPAVGDPCSSSSTSISLHGQSSPQRADRASHPSPSAPMTPPSRSEPRDPRKGGPVGHRARYTSGEKSGSISRP
jgi:hypothetical protein